ncbi:hypothetical protein DVH24_011483 [Malus domestica]|uniref:RNase H type-1 domain-containing protein n=1 Tax=Malus domestica TaxID=3750 RepID=A0A498JTH9_MALDO|nr:hypothetical protein DVH24_011483 [Malus domestica]
MASQRGFQNSILESDSLQIVTALINSSNDSSDTGLLIEDLQHSLPLLQIPQVTSLRNVQTSSQIYFMKKLFCNRCKTL